MARLLLRAVSLAVWFLFGVFLVGMAAVFIADLAAVRGARDLPPPAPVAIESFDPEQDTLDSGETGLAVWLVPDLGPLPQGAPGDPSHATLPLFGPTRETVLGIGRVPDDQSAELREFVASRQNSEGGIIIYGWHKSMPDWVNLSEIAQASGRPVAADPIYLDLFVGDRAGAYADEAMTQTIGVVVFVALTAGLLILVARAVRRWIRQDREERPAPPEAKEVAVTPSFEQPRGKPVPSRPAITSPWDRSRPSGSMSERVAEARPATPEPSPPIASAAHRKKTPEEIVARAFRKPVRRP